jgi:aminoglycoside phosphotransferase family enzyme/predicted kinase
MTEQSRHVDLARSAPAQVHETHSAVVLLLGDYAYKLKKRVNLGFLDFSTEEGRHRVCQREFDLNRRLAPDVYLDIVALNGSGGHEYEYGLVMRRMPDAVRLSTLVTRGEEVTDHLRALAKLMAGFHARAARGPSITAEAGAAGLQRRWTDNLRETEPFCDGPLTKALHARVGELALSYVEGREPLLCERAEAGLFVDGHGDLLADDVFCMPDHPRVLDCIEFDDRLRWVDALDDVCFLAMDLEHLGRPDLATQFLDSYLEFSGTTAPASLRHHYIAYRAFVRAKVSCIRAAQGVESAAASAQSYARLALSHLEAAQPRLVLVGGAPGTGKTTLSRGLADELGWIRLSSDDTRRELPDRGDRYSAAAKSATYAALLDRAGKLLERGECVLADATWGDAAQRRLAEEIAARTASRLIAVECHAPVDVAAQRVQRRLTAGTDSSEADAEVARRLAAHRDPWPAATTIRTDTSPEVSLGEAVVAVTSSTSREEDR